MKPNHAKAWIFTSTSPAEIFSSFASVNPAEDLIVAADGGLQRVAELGLEPDLIIGDLDSADPELLKQFVHVPIQRFSPEKDETDAELAVLWCLERQVGEIVICNGLAGRFDHSLALVQNLALIKASGVTGRIEGEGQLLFFLDSRTDLGIWNGCRLSLVAWQGDAEFASSEGLQFPLAGLTLSPLRSRGISNRIVTPDAWISLISGQVLALISK